MTKEHSLNICLTKLKELEYQEQQITTFQRKAHQVIEQAFGSVHAITNIHNNDEILHRARRELDKLERNFLDELIYEKRKLQIQKTELESEYRKLRFEIENHKKG